MRNVAAMAQGDWLESLDGARAALAARDDALASADRELTAIVGSAHALAAESIRRVESAQAAIDAAADATALADRDRARLLLDRHRDLITIVTAARESAAAKTIELQRIGAQYRLGSR